MKNDPVDLRELGENVLMAGRVSRATAVRYGSVF